MRYLTLLLFFLLPLFSGCTSTRSIGDLEDTLQEDYKAYDEELWVIDKSNELHAELQSKGLLYADERYDKYINNVKTSLLFNKPLLADTIKIYFTRAAEVNAFALPNGNIYINSGLIAAIPTNEELASIIAHEIAHVHKRHSLKQVISQKNTLIGAHVADLMLFGIGLPYLGAMASITSFSREQETQADAYSLELIDDSGYRVDSLMSAFKRMKDNPALKHVKHSVYSTHPSYDTRIEALSEEIANRKKTDPDVIVNQEFHNLDQQYQAIREPIIIDVIESQLRERHFFLALHLLASLKAENPADEEKALISYYEGEAYRGIYQHPETAAKEKTWIDTGKTRVNQDILRTINQDRHIYLTSALDSYKLSRSSPIKQSVKALKKIGELFEKKGQANDAIEYYKSYLDAAPEALDRIQVQIKISRLENH
ncbi:M48 family metallopeptidase [Aurantivibrio plasticivorans]